MSSKAASSVSSSSPSSRPSLPASSRGALSRLYQRYFGTAEARSTHLALLTHTALFVGAWLLIARRGEAVLQGHTPLLTPQQAQQAASMPLQPAGTPGTPY